jgi:hypothetical protein
MCISHILFGLERFRLDFDTKYNFLHVLKFRRRSVISQIKMYAASDNPAKNRFHPKTGLISFWLAIVTGAIAFLLFVGSFIPESGTYAEKRLNNIFLVFALGIAPILHLAGLILGIVGAFTKNSKKVFPILGIVLNGLPVICAVIIWILLLLAVVAVVGSGGGWT